MSDPKNVSTNSPIGALPRVPEKRSLCSEACHRFQLRHFQIFDFFFFGVALATKADHVRLTAAEALATRGGIEDAERLAKVKEDPEPAFQKLHSFSEYQSEIMLTRSVDNFLCYFSDIIQYCMIKKPELLRSRDQIKTEEVLRFSRINDLVQFLADRKVNELSYGGISVIEEFLCQRLGIKMLDSENERSRVTVAVELRNIYVHNRGIVNQIFLNRIERVKHNYQFVQDQRFHADLDNITELVNYLFDITIRLDMNIASKFGIKKSNTEIGIITNDEHT